MDFLNNLLGDLGSLSAASPVLAALRAVIAIVLVFFLPGFAWTLLFFKRINRLERVGLSIALSIALVTLSMLVLNLALGVRVSAVNAFFDIIALTAIPLAIWYALKRRSVLRKRAAGQ